MLLVSLFVCWLVFCFVGVYLRKFIRLEVFELITFWLVIGLFGFGLTWVGSLIVIVCLRLRWC